jgi:outer membrane receptor protein involved in Fe transport
LDFTISLFDLFRENVVGQAPGNPLERVNNGAQRSQGIETSLTGDVTSDFHIITNLTFLDATVEKGDPDKVGDRLFGVPHFSANAWGLYDLPLPMIPGKLSTGFGIVHVGEREASLPNTIVKLPDYTRFDMGLFYKYKGINLALNLRNLTDEKYYDTLEGAALHAQAPFNWAVTVGYDFE